MNHDSAPLRLLQIGCGKMGGALLDAWLSVRLLARAVVVDPGLAGTPGPEAGALAERVTLVAGADDIPADFAPDILLVAVKPQVLDAALAPCVAHLGAASVVSIVAGKRLAAFEQAFGGGHVPVIRTMPNTPAAVRRGVTACLGNPAAGADPHRLAQVERLFSAAGKVVWLEHEAQFDAVTGLSGSGPAYVFHLVEALAAAGIEAGLSPELAMDLARATVEGAGALLAESEDSAEQLRRNVTSPNGTTEAGLRQLMDDAAGLTALMRRTVAAATDRSRELGRDG